MVIVENKIIKNLRTNTSREVIIIGIIQDNQPKQITEIEYKTIGNKIIML